MGNLCLTVLGPPEVRHADQTLLFSTRKELALLSCPAMPRVRIWPELLGERLAQMDAAFYCQIDEQREFLARGEQQRLIGMAHFWRTQYCQA